MFMALLATVMAQAATTWVETAAIALATGDVVVIVDKTSACAMSNDKGTSNPPVATSVTLSTDKKQITSTVDGNLQWTVTVNNGTYKFSPDGEKFLYCTASNNGVRVGTNTNNEFTISNNFLFNTATNRYIGVFNNQDWRCYETINNNIKNTVLAFYKKTESSVTEPDPVAPTATVTISPEGGDVDYGTEVTLTLDGTDAAGIKYTLDGSDVDGDSPIYSEPIKLKESLTIKAAAYNYSNSKYAFGDEATETYTVEVPDATVYNRVTSISANDVGRKFLLVCEAKTAGMGVDPNVATYGVSVALENLEDGIVSIIDEAVVPVTLGGEEDAGRRRREQR